jgi:hypothetical protein
LLTVDWRVEDTSVGFERYKAEIVEVAGGKAIRVRQLPQHSISSVHANAAPDLSACRRGCHHHPFTNIGVPFFLALSVLNPDSLP